MKLLNEIERAAFDAMNKWRVANGLYRLRDPDDDQFLGDEPRPAKVIDIDRYADDPRHDQCRGGTFKE